MGRPKTNKTEKKDLELMTCNCKDHKGKNPLSVGNFYGSRSPMFGNGKVPVCKKCIANMIDYNDIQTVYDVFQLMDVPYFYNRWEETCIKNPQNPLGNYLRMANSGINEFQEARWKDSIFKSENVIEELMESKKILTESENLLSKEEYLEQKVRDKQNKEDIIRIIGYDPFSNEIEEDKSKMYAKLVSMIGESEDNDESKNSAIISIIKGQNQENKINDVITNLCSDTDSLIKNVGLIKSLTDTKEKLNKSMLALAKDNKISELYSGQKNVGANTLTGMLKKLKSINLDEAQVNLFDINTADGMQQVANLSMKAIVENLNFGDDDLVDMVKFQKGKLDYYEKEYSKLREENRKLKLLCNYNNIDYSDEIFEDTYKEVLEYTDVEKEKQQNNFKELNEKVKKVKLLSTDEYMNKVIEDKKEQEKLKLLEESGDI